jgi:hypothetical protein
MGATKISCFTTEKLTGANMRGFINEEIMEDLFKNNRFAP